jgi:hypothetical protein
LGEREIWIDRDRYIKRERYRNIWRKKERDRQIDTQTRIEKEKTLIQAIPYASPNCLA